MNKYSVKNWITHPLPYPTGYGFSPHLLIRTFKKGSKIHIKKENRGKFTDYCNGKVTDECIQKGKNSSDPKIRKRAIFAQNVRRWKKNDN